jgi:integrase/recombinase XerC
VKLARVLGFVPWSLEVENVESVPYRDTRGPGRAGYRLLLDALDERLDAKAKRDRAVLRLLYDCALRRGEVVSLDLEHVDLEASAVSVLGKKRTARERVTLPEPTAAALAGWIEARGEEPGPLFTNFDRAGKGSRLTGNSLYRLVRDLGDEQGLRARPHGLRHAAITEALDLTNGNVRAVAKFSRHRDLRVLEVYDDSRRDLAGEVARLVAGNAEKANRGTND